MLKYLDGFHTYGEMIE